MRSGKALRLLYRLGVVALVASSLYAHARSHSKDRPQDTGFLNRRINVSGVVYKYQVYLPEDWTPKQKWPVILFLHGRGERGSDGFYETQVALPQAIRSHPDRWPFVVVMPQSPFAHFWTDPEMMTMAMASLDAEEKEFQGDPQRIYLTGDSMGGYGVWELARDYPGRFAAIAPVCGGIFWSYAPQRWHEPGLAASYAEKIGRTPAWLFHGLDDTVVLPKQSEVMFDALKAAGGRVRLWEYVAQRHNAWDKAYWEPELPRWFLSHRLADIALEKPYAEKEIIPLHPLPAKISPTVYDAYEGDYRDGGNFLVTIFRQGDDLFQKSSRGDLQQLLPETATTFFYPSGSATRLTFEKDSSGKVTEILYRDDRHEERWPRVHTGHGQDLSRIR